MEEKPKDAIDLDLDIAAAASSGPMSGINPTDVSTIKVVKVADRISIVFVEKKRFRLAVVDNGLVH